MPQYPKGADVDAIDLLAACIAFEAEHGTACLLIAMSEIVNIRAEESGIEMVEDEDGNVDLVLPVMN